MSFPKKKTIPKLIKRIHNKYNSEKKIHKLSGWNNINWQFTHSKHTPAIARKINDSFYSISTLTEQQLYLLLKKEGVNVPNVLGPRFRTKKEDEICIYEKIKGMPLINWLRENPPNKNIYFESVNQLLKVHQLNLPTAIQKNLLTIKHYQKVSHHLLNHAFIKSTLSNRLYYRLKNNLDNLSNVKSKPKLAHFDYCYDNIIITGSIQSIIDWESASIIDPWLDMIMMLTYHIENNDSLKWKSVFPHLDMHKKSISKKELFEYYSHITNESLDSKKKELYQIYCLMHIMLRRFNGLLQKDETASKALHKLLAQWDIAKDKITQFYT